MFWTFLPRPKVVAGIALLFFTVGFLTYGTSLRNDFVTWDDIGLILENPDVQRPSLLGVSHSFSRYDPELYIPLTFVSYQIDQVIGGGSPYLFHLTNLLLHGLNALLVTALLYALLGSGGLSLFLGLVFLLHPLNTEAVSWASARKDVLSTFFFLFSLLSYIEWRSCRNKVWLLVSLFVFLLALLSKVVAVTLPVVLILLDYLEGRGVTRESLKEKVPYFALAVLFGVVAAYGKTENLVSTTLLVKILLACKSTVFVLRSFILPTHLAVAYPQSPLVSFLSPDILSSVALCGVLGLVVLRLWKRDHVAFFGAFFFLLTLAPTFANFSKGGDLYFASDRYAYIPMIGLLLVLGRVIGSRFFSSLFSPGQSHSIQPMLAVITLVVLGALSSVQSGTWRNSEALYAHSLSLYPEATAIRNNLGMEYLRKGDATEALKLFDEALTQKDDPRVHTNKAAALLSLGRTGEAKTEYELALAKNPQQSDAEYGLGNIALRLGRDEEAESHFLRALALSPEDTNALNNLGALYLRREEWRKAAERFKESVSHRSDFPESHYNLALAYIGLGDRDTAKRELTTTLELSPDNPDALSELAAILYEEKDIPGAAELLKKALARDSENPAGRALLRRMQADGVVR